MYKISFALLYRHQPSHPLIIDQVEQETVSKTFGSIQVGWIICRIDVNLIIANRRAFLIFP